MSGFDSLYRPKKWDDLVGNESVIASLKGELNRDSKKQAYLFTGETGIGKTTIARLFSSYLLSKDKKPVNVKTCPDYNEINVGDNSGVDFIRELAENTRFRPSVSPYRIFVLDEVQALSTQARNALLKVLEEPPAHTIFILCSMEGDAIHKALKTRCMNFQLELPDEDQVAERLQKIAKKEKIEWVNSKVAKKIALASGKSIRRAVTILEELSLNETINSKKAEKIDKYISKIIDHSSDSNDKICANILAAIYKGEPNDAYEHACNVNTSELSSVLQMLYQNKYLIDRVVVPKHPKTAHWGMNKTLSNAVGKQNLDDVIHVQKSLVILRQHFASAAVPVGVLLPTKAYELAQYFRDKK